MSKRAKERLDEYRPDARLVDERGPTLERWNKAAGNVEVGDTGTLTVCQSPVERGYRRGKFTGQQYRAAQKFYNHWYRSGSGMEICSPDCGRIPGGDFAGPVMARSEDRAFHWDRLTSAINVIRTKMADAGHNGGDAVKAVYHVVCADQPFERAGQFVGYAGKRAEVVALLLVKCSLNILVREWGL